MRDRKAKIGRDKMEAKKCSIGIMSAMPTRIDRIPLKKDIIARNMFRLLLGLGKVS